jgi:hypothetical protein
MSKFKPQKTQKDFKSMGISHEDVFQIGDRKYVMSGVDGNEDNENDYGIRLFVIEDNNLIFRSKGRMDSWYLNLTFFRSKLYNNRILILAETGDESGSYGFEVYEVLNTKIKSIGHIGASILENETILSAAPFTDILENADGYVFTFTRDVTVQDDKTYKYKTISRQLIKYIYDGKGDIKEIIE